MFLQFNMSLFLIESVIDRPNCTSTFVQLNSYETFVQRKIMTNGVLKRERWIFIALPEVPCFKEA